MPGSPKPKTLETWNMNHNVENIKKLISSRPSGWKAKAAARLRDKALKRDQVEVCLIVLEELSIRRMTQVKLASLMDVTPQQVNRLLKGEENFTFQTIHKLQDALGIRIITVEKTYPISRTVRAVEKIATQVVAQIAEQRQIEAAVKQVVAASVAGASASASRNIVNELQPCLS